MPSLPASRGRPGLRRKAVAGARKAPVSAPSLRAARSSGSAGGEASLGAACGAERACQLTHRSASGAELEPPRRSAPACAAGLSQRGRPSSPGVRPPPGRSRASGGGVAPSGRAQGRSASSQAAASPGPGAAFTCSGHVSAGEESRQGSYVRGQPVGRPGVTGRAADPQPGPREPRALARHRAQQPPGGAPHQPPHMHSFFGEPS